MTFLRRLFSNLFLSVVFEESYCLLYGRVFKNGKVVKTIEAKFDDANSLEGRQKISDYIKRQEANYHDVYVGLFFDAQPQGALPVLKLDEYKKYGIKRDGLLNILVGDKFSIYADISAISKARDSFAGVYIDTLYSPIALMYEEILARKLNESCTLFLYSQTESFALAIFDKDRLAFATFFKISNADSPDINAQGLESEDITDITNLLAAQEEEAQNLEEFQSLDELLKVDEDEFADIDYDIHAQASSDVATSVAIFGRDMSVFSHITAAISEYYSNPIYNAKFLEKIVIFENSKTSATFLQYLQSELFLETQVFSVNSAKQINELMQRELAI